MKTPDSFSLNINEKQFSSTPELLKLIKEMIVSYVVKDRDMLNLRGDFPALLVIYVFSGQMADPVIKMQIENGIKIVRVPGNITPISAARSHSQWFCKSVYETKAN